jgi:DNA-binding transcriptional regulator YiaG
MTEVVESAEPQSAPALFNFPKVESLRKHMLLTVTQMAALFGVSRVTYYGWVSGRTMRKTHELHVRRILKQLLAILAEHSWPNGEVVMMSNAKRMERLRSLLGQEYAQDIEDLKAE